MYQLYIANKNYSSWSLRPWLLMHALEIPFLEILKPFGKDSNFQAFSPTAQVPCLHDGHSTVWDSLAICEYLAEDYPQVWPSHRDGRAWARSVTCEMHAGFNALRDICSMNIGVRIELNEISDALQKNIQRINDIFNEGLAKFNGPFLCGENFTVADAFYAPVIFRFQTFNLPLTGAAQIYYEHMLALPSMQAWQNAALAEVWRDIPHDLDAAQYGKIIADLRAQ